LINARKKATLIDIVTGMRMAQAEAESFEKYIKAMEE
jgi:hypothetical protein